MSCFVVVLAFIMALPGWSYAAAEWKEFRSEPGNFAILLPGTPVEEAGNADAASGEIKGHNYTVDLKDNQYLVSYLEFPQEPAHPEAVLDGARDGGLKTSKLISETKIDISGFPGRALTMQSSSGETINSRMFLVKNRLYII